MIILCNNFFCLLFEKNYKGCPKTTVSEVQFLEQRHLPAKIKNRRYALQISSKFHSIVAPLQHFEKM